MTPLVVRRAEIDSVVSDRGNPYGGVVDVRIADARIVALGANLKPEPGDDVFDAAGGALLPGLHDHHIHLTAFAAARDSVALGPPDVGDPADFTTALTRAHRTLAPGRWIRGVGYHESVAGDLDRYRLDAVVPDRPVRVLHRGGALWILNSLAAETAGLETATEPGVERDSAGRPTGRIYGLDGWLRGRLPSRPPDLAAAAHQLLSHGVTGVTDATPTDRPDDIALLAAEVANGHIPQRVVVTGGLDLPDDAAPELERGPVKLVVADHALPSLDVLAASIDSAHRRRRPVAIHCVTRVALLLALAAWDEAGSATGDRVEHAAVAGPAEGARLAALGISVVTQPGFVAERGDTYRSDVDPADRPDLWPCASLLRQGVAVGGSTDAPFGDPNPWRAIAAAIDRRTRSGIVLGPDERVDARRALSLFLTPPEAPGGPPRTVAMGAAADLCLLYATLDETLRDPSSAEVAATIRKGHVALP